MAEKRTAVMDLLDTDTDEGLAVGESTVVESLFQRKVDWFFVSSDGLGMHETLTGPDVPEFDQRARTIYDNIVDSGAKPLPRDQVNYGKGAAAPSGGGSDNVSSFTPRTFGGGNGAVVGGMMPCDDCGKPIEGFESNGKVYTSAALHKSRQTKYGSGCCNKCLKKYK